jgi:hypothetical protein
MTDNYSFVVAAILYSVFEYWMGKTQRTKANSLIEFVAMVIAIFILKIKKGKQDG